MRDRTPLFAEYEPDPIIRRMRRWRIEDADTIQFIFISLAVMCTGTFGGAALWRLYHAFRYWLS